MRTFSRGRLEKAVAHGLIISFVCSVTLLGWGAPQAGAQVVTSAATSESVAVVPLDNLTRVRPEVFGAEAAAALSVELRDRLLLDVLPEMDVTLQMRDLGLNVPLSTAELVRLAAELEVDLLITGQVREAKLVQTPDGPAGEVVLGVRLFDRVTQADVNGALVRSRGPADPEASEDVLLKKALEQAAFQAVQEMKGRPTITATVLWTREKTSFINKNAGDGIAVGMRLAAVRNRARIAVLEVTQVDSTGSYADLVEGAAVRTGDHLRAIYQLPGAGKVGVSGMVGQAAKQGKRYEKVLLAAAALIGLGGFASSSNDAAAGSSAIPNFSASDLANAYEIWEADGIYIPGASLVTWSRPSGTISDQLVCVDVRRSPAPHGRVEIMDAEFDPTYVIDNVPQIPDAVIRIVEYTLDPQTGEVLRSRDERFGKSPTETWQDFIDNNLSELGDVYQKDFLHFGWVAEGPYPTISYLYSGKPILKRLLNDPITGVTEWSFYWNTEPTAGVYLTSVSVPLTYPDWSDNEVIWYDNPEVQDVAGQMVATFHFYSSIGADEMVLQVARHPNNSFSPPDIHTTVIPTNSGIWWWDEYSVDVVLNGVPGAGNMFWWRVGGKNRASDVAPRPYPLNLTNEYGYVWSGKLAFTVLGMTAAGDVRQQRTDIMRARSAHQRVPPRDRGERILSAK